MIELVRNPKGTERKYRKGMMKSMVGAGSPGLHRDASMFVKCNYSQYLYRVSLFRKVVVSERERLVRMEQDNQMWHRFLHEVHIFLASSVLRAYARRLLFQKSSELWDLMEKLRELGVDLDSRKGSVFDVRLRNAEVEKSHAWSDAQ